MSDRFKFRIWDNEFKKYRTGLGINNGLVCTYNDDTCVLEQCTGLKDKNGKLIYEGDIIVKSDVSAIGYSRTRVCKVHWHNDWLSWAITTQYGDTYELSEFEPKQYEIIGNIHENLDLLGESHE